MNKFYLVLLALCFVSSGANANLPTIEEFNTVKSRIECIEGHKFLITTYRDSVSVVQIYEDGRYSQTPQAAECKS